MGGWGGGQGIKQTKQRNKRGGGGGGVAECHSHTQRIIHFDTTAMSSVPTLTVKKLFSVVCGMNNKL